MTVMLTQTHRNTRQAGDTLIEVSIALAILGMVLTGAVVVATMAFRLGQTGRERTVVAEAAQQQLEALRSFRDNYSWNIFRVGGGGIPTGIDTVGSACQTTYSFAGAHCFHMEQQIIAGTTQWVPISGAAVSPATGGADVPSSMIEIATGTPGGQRGCGYDFELHTQFDPIGGGIAATNTIKTRLVNLNYQTLGGAPACP